MKKIIAIVICLVFCVNVMPTSAIANESDESGKLIVTVMRGDSPVAEAKVSVAKKEGRIAEANTDNNGTVSFSIEGGSYSITATKDNSVGTANHVIVVSQDVTRVLIILRKKLSIFCYAESPADKTAEICIEEKFSEIPEFSVAPNNPSNADIIISIGGPKANSKTKILNSVVPWGWDSKKTPFWDSKKRHISVPQHEEDGFKSYAGVVGTVSSSLTKNLGVGPGYDGKKFVLLYGNEIEGTIMAARTFLNTPGKYIRGKDVTYCESKNIRERLNRKSSASQSGAIRSVLLSDIYTISGDTDMDGLTNKEELQKGTEACNWDTDNDGLSDWWETKEESYNPLSKDEIKIYIKAGSPEDSLIKNQLRIKLEDNANQGAYNYQCVDDPAEAWAIISVGGPCSNLLTKRINSYTMTTGQGKVKWGWNVEDRKIVVPERKDDGGDAYCGVVGSVEPPQTQDIDIQDKYKGKKIVLVYGNEISGTVMAARTFAAAPPNYIIDKEITYSESKMVHYKMLPYSETASKLKDLNDLSDKKFTQLTDGLETTVGHYSQLQEHVSDVSKNCGMENWRERNKDSKGNLEFFKRVYKDLSVLVPFLSGIEVPLLDYYYSDTDLDGLPDSEEGKLSPYNWDCDNDEMADGWEQEHGLNPSHNNPAEDPDNDNLPNRKEFLQGTDPTTADTDGDGMDDAEEIAAQVDPNEYNEYSEGKPVLIKELKGAIIGGVSITFLQDLDDFLMLTKDGKNGDITIWELGGVSVGGQLLAEGKVGITFIDADSRNDDPDIEDELSGKIGVQVKASGLEFGISLTIDDQGNVGIEASVPLLYCDINPEKLRSRPWLNIGYSLGGAYPAAYYLGFVLDAITHDEFLRDWAKIFQPGIHLGVGGEVVATISYKTQLSKNDITMEDSFWKKTLRSLFYPVPPQLSPAWWAADVLERVSN